MASLDVCWTHVYKFFISTVSVYFIYFFPAGDGLSSEQRQLQSEALKFARQEMTPNMNRWDEKVQYVYRLSNHSTHKTMSEA